jgi:hypothetical protein
VFVIQTQSINCEPEIHRFSGNAKEDSCDCHALFPSICYRTSNFEPFGRFSLTWYEDEATGGHQSIILSYLTTHRTPTYERGATHRRLICDTKTICGNRYRSRSRWPCCWNCRSESAWLPRLRVRIPLREWCLSLVFVVYCVGNDLCDGLITCSGESYRLCVCDCECPKNLDNGAT